MQSDRNPHAGAPFGDDDASIERVLHDVSIPALMCSMVHITGDPSWIRGDIRPVGSALNEYQGYMTEADKAEIRRRALPAIAAFRDNDCVLPPPPSPELMHEMMSFLACAPVADDVVPMFVEDLHLDGSDAGAITWGDEIPAEVKADAHVVVIGCGEAGLLAGVRLAQAGLPYTVIEKNAGPGGTWWDNRYPGARVDIGSHFYCYSFEPADHWTEYFSQHPELREYFERVMKKHGVDAHCRFNTEVTSAQLRRSDRPLGRRVAQRATASPKCSTRSRSSARSARSTIRTCPSSPGCTTSPGRRSTRRGGTSSVDIRRYALRARRRGRQRLPDRTDDRRRRRTAHRLPAHRAVDVPQRQIPRAGARRGAVGNAASAVLRPLVPLPHVLPGLGSDHRAFTRRSELRRQRRAGDQRDEPPDAGGLRSVDHRPGRRRRGPARSRDARLSGHRQAHAAGQRVVARVPQEAQRRARAHRRSSASSRTASSPSTARSTRRMSSVTPPGSCTTTTCGR